jgi:hypothetical protein
MSKGNTYENDLVKFTFQAVAIANFADNAASAPLTNIRYSLHTGDPGETGTQTTSEAAHAPYARISVARTTAGHTVTNNSASPSANVDFAACTSGTAAVTFAVQGTATSGAGKLMYSGAVTPTINVAAGVTPRLTTASATTEE